MKRYQSILMSAFIMLHASYLGAETPEDDDQEWLDEISLADILLIGSRRLSMDASKESALPYDLIPNDELMRHGTFDLSDILRRSVPAMNVAVQPNLDEASFIRPMNFRGLAPDNLLLLVNGKRRHRGGVLTFLGSGVADGAQGPDLTSIPAIAVENIQVLRDGAAAQYGSDAIAGVVNISLKRGNDGGVVEVRTGSSYEGDGTMTQLAANYGFPLGDSGFINVSAQIADEERTERQVQRSDAASLQANNTLIPDPAQTWGRPDIKDNFKFFLNFGKGIGESGEAYGYTNYSTRVIDTAFYYRTPNGTDRPSRYSNDGGETVLIGDTRPTNGTACPTINIVNGNPVTSPGFAQIASGGQLDGECHAWAEVLPGGFTPVFSAEVEDQAVLLGYKGSVDEKLQYDFSVYWGSSDVRMFMTNSINPSIPTFDPSQEISPGSNIETDMNVNLDFVMPVEVEGLASDLSVAYGFEWRDEEFEVVAGEEASYQAGVLQGQGLRTTLDGYGGFSPAAAGAFSRSNIAAYAELEADVTEDMILQFAIRYEDFDDFGETLNYKLASLYKLTESLSVRGAYSTGFRAPTPGQSNIRRTSTIAAGANVFESGILPPDSALALTLSQAIPNTATARPLEPEESTNISLGLVSKSEGLEISLDYFFINVTDRITLSPFLEVDQNIAAVAAAIQTLLNAGISGADTFENFQFFINDFETETQGFDLVAKFPMVWMEEMLGGGKSSATLLINHTRTEVVGDSDFIDEARIIQLEQGLPETRLIGTVTHETEKWRFLSRGQYYDEVVIQPDIIDGGFDGAYGGKFLLDLEASYRITDEAQLTLGGQNIFDTTPDENPTPADNSGQLYPEESPFPFDGGFYYLRFDYQI